ncbi:MAG: alpha-ketoacid dehydrogenase subunit beta [Desulfobacteraceae bacterium]|nr:MAG: alpha-ketoacid dehydrogenase subunit beta [Desulfobacteraceae bacterium]
MRKLSYSLAINEALHQTMDADPSVFLIGQGVKSPWYVGNTAQGLLEKHGETRIIDTPVSENAITGAAVGAAIAGMKPVVVHPRMDFMFYAFDPIVNQAANWFYMNGGKASAPVVFWGIVNRGGEQAAQHSQAIHSLFAHIPGLKVVMPSTAYDAKGLLISAIRDPNPVVFIDDRWLYPLEDEVPEEMYEIPLGIGAVRKQGRDVTLVGSSYMVNLIMKALPTLDSDGISAEVIDLRTLKPMDKNLILESVKKTGRLVVADGGWKSFGAAAEISATIGEKAFAFLKAPIACVTLPDSPAPASSVLEEIYYPKISDITNTVRRVIEYDSGRS